MIYANSYLAFDVNEGKDVAWSEVSLAETTKEERKRFNDEVLMLQSIDSDKIIHIYDSWYDQEQNRNVLITEYISSGTVAR